MKTIAGDLLPEMEHMTAAQSKERVESENKRPSTLQIETPLITPDQLFDFQIT